MGRHSIGIVDRVYATKSLQHGLHVVYLRNLKDKPVLHNVVSGCLNLCPHNIHSTFAEGARYVLQTMAPVVTFHLNLYPKRGGRARLPGDGRKPLGVLRERFHIGTIAAMHSHTLAKGDIADYIIPGNRPTTLRYPNSHAVHSIYRDSHIPSRRPTWGHNARLQLALCNIRLGVLSALVQVTHQFCEDSSG